jgi:hypothetical protein
VAVAADDRHGGAMMIWAYRRAGKAEPTVVDRLK